MDSTASLEDAVSIDVENVGGIDSTSVELSPGVTVLEGRNATNRTSFLQAIMAAMGSDRFTLKGDAEEGYVKVEFGETVVERRFERRNGRVSVADDGYLDDPEVAELFAFLLEENEARRAVARGDNLHEILTRPIDTNEIEAEIERLQATKRELDQRIADVEDRETELVDLEQRKERLESEVEDHRGELAELEAKIEDADTSLETERESKEAIEEQFDALKERRSELEDIRFEIGTLEQTIESLESEYEEKKSRREELSVDSDRDTAALRRELDELRERKRRTSSQMSELKSIIQFNEEMLEGTDSEIASVLRDDSTERAGDVTEELLDSEESVVCWTCGSDVVREDIESTLDDLREFRQEKLNQRQSVQAEIDDVQDQVSKLERAERELDSLTERLTEIESDVERKEDRIAELEARRSAIREEIEELEESVEDEQSSEYDEILDLHKEANKVELQLNQTESELASLEDEIAEAESFVDERTEYERRREQVGVELEELRNRISDLEENAVEAFNEHMDEVLEVLEYENLARIWIERQEREVRKGRRKVSESYFELHVVRRASSGEAYEGTVETLSESEREVVGLVFAFAGYLVHDLHESVPVMLLDSLEAIDSDRIARLVEYFAEYPEYLVVALLPEDANDVEVGQDVVTEI